MLKPKIKNETGFTLVELLLTIALLSILSVTVINLLREGVIRKERFLNETIAINNAQAKMEEIIAFKKKHGFIHKPPRMTNVNIKYLTPELKKVVVVFEWQEEKDSLVTIIGNY